MVFNTKQAKIDELKAQNELLRKKLDKLNKDHNLLVSNIAHELRTPTTALQAQLENMVDGIVEADLTNLTKALTQTMHLSDLIAYLLDLTRLQANALKLDKQSFPLAPFLQKVLDGLSSYQGEKTLQIKISIHPKDLTIYADQQRFAQITTNLISNAIKHSPKGGSIHVSAFCENRVVQQENGHQEDKTQTNKVQVSETPTSQAEINATPRMSVISAINQIRQIDKKPQVNMGNFGEQRHSDPTNLIKATGTLSQAGSTIEASEVSKMKPILPVVVIRVSDSGPGISDDDKANIFKQFTQGKNSVSGGSGVGLAIVKWATELHGGQIRLIDPVEVGQTGAVFELVLPQGDLSLT